METQTETEVENQLTGAVSSFAHAAMQDDWVLMDKIESQLPDGLNIEWNNTNQTARMFFESGKSKVGVVAYYADTMQTAYFYNWHEVVHRVAWAHMLETEEWC